MKVGAKTEMTYKIINAFYLLLNGHTFILHPSNTLFITLLWLGLSLDDEKSPHLNTVKEEKEQDYDSGIILLLKKNNAN